MPELKTIHGDTIVIDEDDFQWASTIVWRSQRFNNVTYAITGKAVYMHRVLMRAKKGQLVDHINRNGLDNRRENLRFATRSMNGVNANVSRKNTTGYKGVIRYKTGWQAFINFQYKLVRSRTIYNIEQAAMLRDELARQLFGDTVYLNFPQIPSNSDLYAEAYRLINRRLHHES